MSITRENQTNSFRRNLFATTAMAFLVGLGLASGSGPAQAACSQGATTVTCTGTMSAENVFNVNGITTVDANNFTINNGRLRVNESNANITFTGNNVVVNNGNGTLNASASNGVIHINTQGAGKFAVVTLSNSTIVVSQGNAIYGSQGISAQTNPTGTNTGLTQINATNVTVDMQTANSRAALNANSGGAGAAEVNMVGGWVKTNGNMVSNSGYMLFDAGVRANSVNGSANVTLSQGAMVWSINRAAGISAQAGDLGTSSGNATVVVKADAGGALSQITGGSAINRVILTQGDNAQGIYGEATNGKITITQNAALSAAIETRGSDANGIIAFVLADGTGAIAINNYGGILTAGTNSNGIRATGLTGAVDVINAGAITTQGLFASGIVARTTTGAISIRNTGAVTTQGGGSPGINTSTTDGTIEITNNVKIATAGGGSIGIYAIASGTGTIGIENDADIATTGSGATGIAAETLTGAISIVNGAAIDTKGVAADGISAATIGSGAIEIENSAAITISGDTAFGIFSGAMNGATTITNEGEITTSGIVAYGIYAMSSGTGAVEIENDAVITTTGASATGIAVFASGSGDITVTNTAPVSATGLGASGIQARAAAGAARITNDSDVLAGGGASVGVAFGGVTQSLTNNGTISALSDRAVLADLSGNSGTVTLTNHGTMTGTVTAAASTVTFDNPGTWNIRSFADTTGTGVRDTLAVAVSDFGASGANVINNTGTINLLGDSGAAQTLDATGAYQPLGLASTAMAIGGPVQGQIFGVSTFNHSGVIDLTGGGNVAGNVLVISGGNTAGADGGGTFVTNGGSIVFNTVLNEGGANSQSDMLVVDSTRMGSGAAALVLHTTGDGAQTVGNGILLVEVLNKAASANGVFILANGPVAAGAYQYTLYHGGVGADASDGNWYLRNMMPDPDVPNVSGEPNNHQASQVPDYRPSFPVVATITPLATEYGFSMARGITGGFDNYGLYPDGAGPGAPAYEERVVWCKDPRVQFRCVVHAPVGWRADTQKWFPGAWARVIGERGIHDNDRNFDRRGPDYDYNFWGVQAGLDLYGRMTAQGAVDRAGIYAGYGQISSNVERAWTRGRAGSIDMDAYTLGGYWRHRYEQGFYTNAVVQGTWYSADTSTVDGYRYKPDGFGILASLEGGYAIRLGNGLVLEPQAQVMYENVSFDNVRDPHGLFKLDDGDSLRGRLGVRVAKGWNIGTVAMPRLLTLWGRVNVWHEFMGGHKTTASYVDGTYPVTVNAKLGGTWGEVEAGVKGQVSDAVTLFAAGGYNHSLDNRGREAWNGRLGVKIDW